MAHEDNLYSEKLVRSHDRDRYLLALGADKGGVPALFPLFAFNYEIAKTREVVSEPQLGLIRLQWWRDALESFYVGRSVPKHEVLDALIPVIEQSDLPFSWFEDLLDGREADLENGQPETLSILKKYAEKTVFPLNRLALKVAGQDEDVDTVRRVSMSYGLVGLMRAIPWHAAQGRIYLPADAMEAHSIAIDDLKKQRRIEGLDHVVGSVLSVAKEGLQEKPKSRYLQISQRLARFYLQRLQRYGGNLYDSRLHTPPSGFLLRLLLEDYLPTRRKS